MEILRDVLRELWAERGRLIFVTSGVVWGTVGLTFLLAFGHGFDDAMQTVMENGGARTLVIDGRSTTKPFQGQPPGRPVRVTRADVDAMRSIPELESVSGEFTRSRVPTSWADQTVNARVLGVEAAYGAIRTFMAMPGGRFLNRLDVRERRRVAFLGERVKQRLFGDAPAVGETVRVRGVPFLVIGVARPKVVMSNYDGEDRDKICIPISTFQSMFGWRTLQHVAARLHDATADRAAIDRVFGVLGRRCGFDAADRSALYVRNRPMETRRVRGILDGMNVFLAILGVLGLIVAVIGVANSTYVMVEERTRELGIQIAVGARPAGVARRHLVEAMFVVAVGGLFGLLCSAGLLWGINQIPLDDQVRGYLGTPVVSVPVALTVTSLLGVAGAIAGWIPARRAAAVQPVEALRSE